MKVGEVWKLVNPSAKIRSDCVHADVIEITRIYRDEVEMQDYVEFSTIFDSDFYLDEFSSSGGAMKREDLLNDYRREYNESR